MADGVVRVAAPAKVNLYLHILARRADGYHQLDSLVAFADVGDEVSAAPADGLSLEIAGPFASALAGQASQDNLVLTAARRLAAHHGIQPGARLRLVKNLPVAAGLGGGSSDAAATLRALATLWRLEPRDGSMPDLAAGLGADVPVCLHGRTARIGGIGETISAPPALPDWSILLVHPGVELATASVFDAFDAAPPPPPAPAIADADAVLARARNDLEAAARSLAPAVGQALATLAACPGALCHRMSGSGASCFALFASPAEAARAAGMVREIHPNWWIYSGKFLT